MVEQARTKPKYTLVCYIVTSANHVPRMTFRQFIIADILPLHIRCFQRGQNSLDFSRS